MPAQSLDVRPVIVIGAGGDGIGTAIARGLLRIGTPVIAVDLEIARLNVLTKEMGEGAATLQTEIADATDAESVDALFQRIEEEHPELGGLVNVVGGLPADRFRSLVEDDDENLDALLDTNLRAAVRTSRAFARARLGQFGSASQTSPTCSIVQVATIAALEGMPFGAGYAASKAALLSYTRTMALEWGSLGIRVNALAPGSIRVPKNDQYHDPDRDARVLPLGRRGTPDDVAGGALFLLSQAASWITGQVLVVDGGASVKPSYLDDEGLPVFVQDPALRSRLLK